MSLGQRARLTIAAAAGYGDKGCEDRANAAGSGLIPPGADLVFDVELLDVAGRRSTLLLHKYRQTLDGWAAKKLADKVA